VLRRGRREKEPQVGLVATEDGRPMESDAMILALTPDEALVVNVTSGLGGGAVVEPAQGILVQTAYRVGYHREESNVRALYGRECLRYLASAFFCRCSVWGGASG